MDHTVHGILQARILEWVAFPFSRGSSWPRDQTSVSCFAGGFLSGKPEETKRNLFSSVQLLSHVWLCDPMPGFPVLHQLLKLAQTHVHWVGDAIQPSSTLSSPSPPAFNLSQHQGLCQWVSPSYQVAKVLEFQDFSISPSNKNSGLISFTMDWLDLLEVQGTLKSLLQHGST